MNGSEMMFTFSLIGISSVLNLSLSLFVLFLRRVETDFDEIFDDIWISFETGDDQRRDLSDGCSRLFMKNLTSDIRTFNREEEEEEEQS